MRRLLIGSVFAIAWTAAAGAQADVYPSRPVTLVVPVAAGGTIDISARILAEHMRVRLGQPVVIENVTGAGGSIGTGRVVRAEPDGYTVIFGGLNTHVINAAILRLPYDVLEDLQPIALTSAFPLMVVAKKTMPASDLKELIALLAANPDKPTVGTGGSGSPSHLAALLFQQQTDTRFAIVPYRGTGVAIKDLVAGHTDLMIDALPNALPHVRAGTIKAYAVMAKNRLAVAPEIPTVDEAGLPGFYMQVWLALWAPKGTPKPVVDKLNAAVVLTLDDPAVRSRLTDLGQQIFPREQLTPQALADFNRAELERWRPTIEAANIKAQ
jgi:tripartite-type tricarboxylate transporter receptor subunit TctC